MTINTASRTVTINNKNIDFALTVKTLAAEWQQSIDVYMPDGRWVGTVSPNGNIELALWARR